MPRQRLRGHASTSSALQQSASPAEPAHHDARASRAFPPVFVARLWAWLTGIAAFIFLNYTGIVSFAENGRDAAERAQYDWTFFLMLGAAITGWLTYAWRRDGFLVHARLVFVLSVAGAVSGLVVFPDL